MFDDFLNNCPMDNEIKPDKKRVGKNIAAVTPLIKAEGRCVPKRRLILKPLTIAAAITALSAVTLVTVNASMQGAVVRFLMGGEELGGSYSDYVDGDGYRRIKFSAVLPVSDHLFAIIYDVDAPGEENLRVITQDADPDFLNSILLYREAVQSFPMDEKETNVSSGVETQVLSADPNDPLYPKPDDFGLFFKDSEICVYSLREADNHYGCDGILGGKFMNTGAAAGTPSGSSGSYRLDRENGTGIFTFSFYYYVGNERS